MVESGEKVFYVEHARVLSSGAASVKMIGIYSTKEKAEEAVKRLCMQPGFCDSPECFTIDLYLVDEGHWQDGFVT